MLLLVLATHFAAAADWLSLQGSEVGRPDVPVHVSGFIQPQFDAHVLGDLIDGQRPIFNTVNGGGPTAFQVRRARVGLRGAVPKTGQRISYFLMTESGQVSLTRGAPVVFSDMSVTLSMPGARVRVGQFKLPVMEEIQNGVARSLEFIHFSTTLVGLLLENPIEEGSYTGPSRGFRDVGVQVFEGFQEGSFAGSYAVMVSNGGSFHAIDQDAGKDLTLRGELAWVTDGERHSPTREEVKIGAWWLEGTRPGEDGRARRMRRGAFVHVEQEVAWGLVEVAQGVGVLEAGRASPFADGALRVVEDAKAFGVVAQGGVRVKLGEVNTGLKLRYDRYDRQYDADALRRVFHTGSLGLEVDPVPRLRLQANVELRRLVAPNGQGRATEVAAAMGHRLTAQATVFFGPGKKPSAELTAARACEDAGPAAAAP